MVGLDELWLAIMIAAPCVFFASAIMWMLLPHHKQDIRFLQSEESLISAITPLAIKPGLYMFPNCEHAKDMKTEAFQAKWSAGPWGTINIMGKQPNFALNLAKTFLTFLVITVLVAYLTGVGVGAGAGFGEVFGLALGAGVLGHCMGGLPNDFFLGKPTRFIVTTFIDGVVYALITAFILASMWPGSPVDGVLISQ